MKKRLLPVLLAVMFVLVLLPVTVYADAHVHTDADRDNVCDDVSCGKKLYIQRGWNGTAVTETLQAIPDDAVTITSSITEFTTGWYVADGAVTVPGSINIPVDAEVNLILCDGAQLTVNGQIGNSNQYNSEGNLTIYGQAADSGKLTAVYTTRGAYSRGIKAKAIVIHGGDLDLTANNSDTANNAIGISSNTTGLVMYGGNLKAVGNNDKGMGFGIHLSSKTAYIYGGHASFTGNGAGQWYTGWGINSGTMYIYGGDVEAAATTTGTVTALGVSAAIRLYGGSLTSRSQGKAFANVPMYKTSTMGSSFNIPDGLVVMTSSRMDGAGAAEWNKADALNGDSVRYVKITHMTLPVTNAMPYSSREANHAYLTITEPDSLTADVTVTFTADAGYTAGGVTVRTADGTAVPAVKQTDGTYKFTMPGEPVFVTGALVPPHTHEIGGAEVVFEKITDQTGLFGLFENGGSGYLANDITLTALPTVTAAAPVNLCLCGKVLDLANGSSGYIETAADTTFNLYDCDTTTTHKFTVDANGRWTRNESAASDYRTLTGGCITGGYGALYIRGSGSMNGGNIVGNYSSGLWIEGTAFTMNGGAIIGNQGGYYGGGVRVLGTSVFTMNDGLISENVAGSAGGGVCVKDTTASFILNGGSITKNKANSDYGGGVCAFGLFPAMTGGLISENVGPVGGGVIAYKGMKMTGGSIIGNTATSAGGGLYNSDRVTVGGTAVVKDNLLNGVPNNLYSGYVGIASAPDAPAAGMSVGLNAIYMYVSNASSGQEQYFSADDPAYEVKYDMGVIRLVKHTHDDLTFAKITTEAQLQTLFADGGSGYLVNDITLTAAQTVSATAPVSLCLNGRVLDLGGYNITVNAGSAFDLYDCGTAVHTFTADNSTGLWTADSAGTKSVTGGVITGGSAQSGGAICCAGTLSLHGGNLVGNSANYGGSVYIDANGKLEIADGAAISGCYAAKDGGAVYTVAGSTFDLKGGTLSCNTVGYNGGALYACGAFNMSGGVIEYNASTNTNASYNYGCGGVLLSGASVLSGGEIRYNSAVRCGGGVGVWGGTVEVTGTKISENTAGLNGGGVFIQAGSLTLRDGAQIADNVAGENGGGVYVNGGTTFRAEGGQISGNEAGTAAAGVYCGASVTVGGTAKITGNYLPDGTTASNLYLPDGVKVVLGTKTGSDDGNGINVPASGMAVSLSTATDPTISSPLTVTDTASEEQAQYFTADDPDYAIRAEGGKFLFGIAHVHNWSGWAHDDGYHWKVCTATGCPIVNVSEMDSYGAHSFVNYISDNNGTCEGNGTKTATCTCGVTDTVPDPGSASGHLYVNFTSNGDATCTKDGTMTAFCARGCGRKTTVTEKGSALGHDYVTEVVAATTTTQGYTLHTCSRCGDSYKDNYTDPSPAVVTVLAGDFNGDGKINGKDLVTLRQYLAGMEDVVIDLNAEMNGDGVANGKDLTLLRKYLAGIDVDIVG